MESRLVDYLDQMRRCVIDAVKHVEDQSEEEFINDRKTRQAVIFCLLLIGETSRKIMDRYPDFVAEHDAIPWREMRGMRNRIAHRYFEIDLTVVWDTVQNELPNLSNALERLG